jgi:hypothetical protein
MNSILIMKYDEDITFEGSIAVDCNYMELP